MCSAAVCTSVDEEHWQETENGMDQSLVLDHLLHNIEVPVVFVHTGRVEGAHEDRFDLVPDRVFYLVEPVVADSEAVVATALDLDPAVLDLDNTHLTCFPHLAYFQVKDTRHLAAAEEAVSACHSVY